MSTQVCGSIITGNYTSDFVTNRGSGLWVSVGSGFPAFAIDPPEPAAHGQVPVIVLETIRLQQKPHSARADKAEYY
ncbi:hypothetical protein [Pontibacter liquoris]|uniref:hypothetical protein n=1 Tax=Pontibacter liquoris TaxID=2905677 RepID=UPI001FA74072|nr:hypothetical protein [Pontibacter liquoris]